MLYTLQRSCFFFNNFVWFLISASVYWLGVFWKLRAKFVTFHFRTFLIARISRDPYNLYVQIGVSQTFNFTIFPYNLELHYSWYNFMIIDDLYNKISWFQYFQYFWSGEFCAILMNYVYLFPLWLFWLCDGNIFTFSLNMQ